MPSQEPSAKPRRRSISSWPVDSNRDSNAERITTTVGGHLGTEKLRYQYGQSPQWTVPDNPLIVWDQEVGSSNLPAPTKTLIFAQFSFENCHHRWSFSLGLPQGMSISDLLVFSPDR